MRLVHIQNAIFNSHAQPKYQNLYNFLTNFHLPKELPNLDLQVFFLV